MLAVPLTLTNAEVHININVQVAREHMFIREHGGWEDFDMVLVENYPCNNKHELHARERHHIQELKANLNRQIPTRAKQEFYLEHRDPAKQRVTHRQYYETHQDECKERQKRGRNEDPERFKAYDHKKYEKNKESIKARKSVLEQCECGNQYIHSHAARWLLQ